VHAVVGEGSGSLGAAEAAGFREPGGDTWLDFQGDAAIYGRDQPFPGTPLRLGATGALRDQRFVEVFWMPVVWNPVTRQATIVTHIDAEVVFAPPTGRASPFRPDPRFEKVYASSLLNYEQGKIFRAFGAGRGARRVYGGPAAALTESLEPPRVAAGTSRYKLQVTQEGVYHLDAAWMTTTPPICSPSTRARSRSRWTAWRFPS